MVLCSLSLDISPLKKSEDSLTDEIVRRQGEGKEV